MRRSPALIEPSRSSVSTTYRATRSFALPPGLSISSLARTRRPLPANSRSSATIGVPPMHAATEPPIGATALALEDTPHPPPAGRLVHQAGERDVLDRQPERVDEHDVPPAPAAGAA